MYIIHLHTGESTRCIAWIIKNTKSTEVMTNVLNSGAFKHLVFLVKSEHAVMQNEGLISITLLTSYIPGGWSDNKYIFLVV